MTLPTVYENTIYTIKKGDVTSADVVTKAISNGQVLVSITIVPSESKLVDSAFNGGGVIQFLKTPSMLLLPLSRALSFPLKSPLPSMLMARRTALLCISLMPRCCRARW